MCRQIKVDSHLSNQLTTYNGRLIFKLVKMDSVNVLEFYLMKLKVLKFVLLASAVVMAPATADTGKVKLPENYGTTFVRYSSVDKPNAENPEKTKMRFFYVNPESLAAAQANKPVPEGTVLIMEDRAVQRDSDGKPLLDSAGRFIPTDKITNIFIQEKQSGWGEQYPQAVRNGEWEYAWFTADGSRKADKTMDGCFACHKGAEASDYNFTFTPFVATIKK